MEQLFFDMIDDDATLGCLSKIIEGVSKTTEMPYGSFKISPNLNKDVVIGYSINFDTSLVAKINVDMSSFSASRNTIDLVSGYIKSNPLQNPSNFIKYEYNDKNLLISALTETIIAFVNEYTPSEQFGCCHRYIECSNAKKCIAPDKLHAKRCQYRKNLENGRIFYGKNANTKTISGGGDTLETSFETKKE